jgi:prepilin-type N-terminal cleavage/methylation domain-containing protein
LDKNMKARKNDWGSERVLLRGHKRDGDSVVALVASEWVTSVPSDNGFTLVELLVTVGILLAMAGAMIELARGAHGAAQALGDISDVQQKMRVAADAIQHDLLMAGAGGGLGADEGPLIRYLPPIRPSASLAGESDVTYSSERITVLYVPQTRAEAEVAAGMSVDGPLPMGNGPACVVDPLCGFEDGMQAIVFDRTGPGFGYDVFTIGNASPGWIARSSGEGNFSQIYTSTAVVREVVQRIYYLDRSDAANVRLMRSDGRSTFPLVDGLSELRFTYLADPDPSSVFAGGAAGGTCVYAPGAPPRALLAPLGGISLAELSVSDLTDGPFCGIPPTRFDADLLRVRRVRVSLRTDIAGGSRSARASSLFELTFDVSPRNFNFSR